MMHMKRLLQAIPLALLPALMGVSISAGTKTAPAVHPRFPAAATYYTDNIPLGIEDTIWVAPRSIPGAAAVVVHGLNLKPSRMNDIVSELNKKNILVLRVSLTGHRGDLKEFKRVERSDWLIDLLHAYRIALEKAESLGIPLYFVGYSLGCPVVLDLMISHKEVSFDKTVFFAPAIALRNYTHLIKLFNIFGKTAVIPGRTPHQYRANFGTPVSAYNALFQHINKINSTGYGRLNIETLIFLDPKDELVSHKALQRLIFSERLDKWHFISISTDLKNPGNKYHHLMIDPDTAGEEAWNTIIDLMSEHLGYQK
jgi:alpha-beta hydrolase superfamily lysophospholipase